jgi:hypothetical protein
MPEPSFGWQATFADARFQKLTLYREVILPDIAARNSSNCIKPWGFPGRYVVRRPDRSEDTVDARTSKSKPVASAGSGILKPPGAQSHSPRDVLFGLVKRWHAAVVVHPLFAGRCKRPAPSARSRTRWRRSAR